MSEVVIFQELACDNGKLIGVATLNSERSLNALSKEMIDELSPKLAEWKDNDEIAVVILQGAGEKAFCAGGDIVNLYKAMDQHPNEYADYVQTYFTEEYKLDYLIHTFEKPFLVWGNGIVMGGGLGMMVGGSHRVVTESSRIAMPEISIGLYPDVGGTWFLNRMPENIGLFLGLTGASINAADAKFTGLADYFVSADNKEGVLGKLLTVNWGDTKALNHDKLSDVLHDAERSCATKQPQSNIRAHETLISSVMNFDNLADIVGAIVSAETSEDDKWFVRAQKSLKHGSAMSGQIVYRQMNEGKSLSLAECFRMELSLSVKAGKFGEFREGVRALLIDKDNQPKWAYNSIADVPEEKINWFFEPLWSKEEHPLKSLGE